MKKIFMNISAGTTLAVAIALTACNNAEQVKKQVDEQNAKIQSQVDEKLNAVKAQADADCTAKVDSAAQVAFAAWQDEQAKGAKKGGKKPAPKPKPKETPKKETPKTGNEGKKGGGEPPVNEGKKATETGGQGVNMGKKH